MDLQELKYRQALPLSIKIAMTKSRLREYVNYYGLDGVYISFSGGKDSTVLLDIARKLYPNILAVFMDTWMEYPQLRKFTKTFDNVKVLKPSKSMKEIIKTEGWCFPSKDVAQMIAALRQDNPPAWAKRKIMGLDKDGNYSEYRQMYKKWLPLVDAPFLISPGCCVEMKEKPLFAFEKETGRHPIVALMADESARRKEAYLRTGCNSFDTKRVLDEETGDYVEVDIQRPISKPLGFWTENDILQYIKENELPIAEPYGKVVVKGSEPGQISLCDIDKNYCQGCKFQTTGEKRTGCMFCPVGCHLDKFAKFNRLKKYNQDLYDYCMEELGEKEVLQWIDKHYVSKVEEY